METIKKNLLYAWKCSFRRCFKSAVTPTNTAHNFQANDRNSVIDEDTAYSTQDWRLRRGSLHDICI